MKSPLGIFFLLLTTTLHAGIAEGVAAYEKGDYATARIHFIPAANAGDPKGLHLLASLYYQGHGAEKDINKAITLFSAAAAKGYVGSQANLGVMYHNGEGIEKNIPRAVEYYVAAAKQGDLQSAFNLGQIYRSGDGVAVDYRKAAVFYQFAAKRGYIPAVNELGLLYAQGHGVKQDYVEAYGWIAYAAKTKDVQSTKNFDQLKQLLGPDLGKAEARAKQIEAEMPKKGG